MARTAPGCAIFTFCIMAMSVSEDPKGEQILSKYSTRPHKFLWKSGNGIYLPCTEVKGTGGIACAICKNVFKNPKSVYAHLKSRHSAIIFENKKSWKASTSNVDASESGDKEVVVDACSAVLTGVAESAAVVNGDLPTSVDGLNSVGISGGLEDSQHERNIEIADCDMEFGELDGVTIFGSVSVDVESGAAEHCVPQTAASKSRNGYVFRELAQFCMIHDD